MQLHLRAIARLASVVPVLAMEYLTSVEPCEYEGDHDGSQYAVAIHGNQRTLTISRNGVQCELRASLAGETLNFSFDGTTHPEIAALCEALGLKSSSNGKFEPIAHETLVTRLSDIDACRLLMTRLKTHSDTADVVINAGVRLLTFAHTWQQNRATALGTDERRAARAEKQSLALEEDARKFKEWSVPGLTAITLLHDPRYCCMEVVIDGYREMSIPAAHFDWPLGGLISHASATPTAGSGKYAVKPTKVAAEVLGVLSAALIDGNTVRLTRQLDAKLYKKVNEFLNEMGGSWHTGKQAHVFDSDPTEQLRAILGTGTVFTSKDYEFFRTGPNEVERVVRMAELEPGHTVGEPSAGQGAIAMACAEVVGREKVTVHELMPANVDHLQKLGFAINGPSDFLAIKPVEAWDRVCMNPPFSGGRDIVHVMHALDFLKPGGILVAIMSTSWQHAGNSRSAKFRAFLEQSGAKVESIAAGAFREAGTDVPTTLVRIVKPMKSTREEPKTVAREPREIQADLFA